MAKPKYMILGVWDQI